MGGNSDLEFFFQNFKICFLPIELLDDEQYNFQVEFHGPNNRAYYLGAESQETMEQWMKAIACAGYDYMKLLVAELRQQLQELESKSLEFLFSKN